MVSSLCKSYEYVCYTWAQCLTGWDVQYMDDSGEETHHFGKNRGDFTYFTFTTPSWLQHISKHGSFTPHAIALPPKLSLGTSRAAFFRVASRPETYMAVGASQIHLHIAHLTQSRTI